MRDRCIMHIDCNSFFASVSLLYKPWLRDKPVVVGGSEELRHGIVLAKNQPAKKFKIPTGAALWEARQLCPDLVVIPPDYELYDSFSRDIKQYLSQFTPLLESFGSDECWIDITSTQHLFGGPKALAEKILQDVKTLFGITVSIGVSWNKIYAKLGSDFKKPDAVTYIMRRDAQDTRWQKLIYPLPAEEMIYIGPATKRKLNNKGVYTLGDIAQMGEKLLVEWFGKIGSAIYLFASGQDYTPVSPIGEAPLVKSVGNSCTTPRDLVDYDDIHIVISQLCETTCRRMREHGVKAGTVSVHARRQLPGGEFSYSNRQKKLEQPINATVDFTKSCFELMQQIVRPGERIRSLGVRGESLYLDATPYQCELGVDVHRQERLSKIDEARDSINKRFGKTCLVQARSMKDQGLLGLGTKISQEFAPVSYFK